MRRKEIVLPRVYRPKDDNPRKWHVEYSVYDEVTDKMQRFRVTKGFAACNSIEESKANANRLKSEIKRKLLNGWTPFNDSKKVIWSDSIEYHKITKNRIPTYRTRKTVHYYSTKFLETKAHTAPSSHKSYMSKLRRLKNWLIENKLNERDVSLITIVHAKMFIESLDKPKKTASKTKNEYLRLFSEFWSFITKDRKRLENIWSDFNKFPNDSKPQRPIKNNVLKLLKKELKKQKPQLWLAAQFMYYCFIRPGELRQMQIKHLDLYESKAVLYSGFTKASKSRVVDIAEVFVEILFKVYKLHKYPDHFYIFTKEGEPGPEPVKKNYFNRQFLKIRRQLELPEDYKFYGFKHTGAVVAIRNGADIKEIQNQMGHSSIQTTDEYLKSMVGYESEFFRKKMKKI